MVYIISDLLDWSDRPTSGRRIFCFVTVYSIIPDHGTSIYIHEHLTASTGALTGRAGTVPTSQCCSSTSGAVRRCSISLRQQTSDVGRQAHRWQAREMMRLVRPQSGKLSPVDDQAPGREVLVVPIQHTDPMTPVQELPSVAMLAFSLV